MPYPDTDLDRPQRIVETLGSFWAGTYASRDFVESFVAARSRLDTQALDDFNDLLTSVSRFKVPVYQVAEQTQIVLLESQLTYDPVFFDSGREFDDGLTFDQPPGGPPYVWPAPANLVAMPVLATGIVAAGRTWVAGLDYVVRDGGLHFSSNPFDLAEADVRDVMDGNDLVDRECRLWAYRASFDHSTISKQFGYVAGLQHASSANYRDYVNAVLDAFVLGPSELSTRQFFATLMDAPLAIGTETVVDVFQDELYLWIITNAQAYRARRESESAVAVDTVVQAGDPLTRTVTFYDFNRGQVPDDIAALAVGRELLPSGYLAELTFENQALPTTITEAWDDESGLTRLTFPLGGFPGDVEKFWTDLHDAGVRAGQTLAMLLDTRETKTGQPTATALPASINPFAFLTANVLRNNGFVVKLQPGNVGPDAIGLGAGRHLRRILPPHTVGIVLVELTAAPEIVRIDEMSTSQSGTVAVLAVSESLDLVDYSRERAAVRPINSQCIWSVDE